MNRRPLSRRRTMRGTSQSAQVCRLRGQSLKRALQVNASVSLRQSVHGDPLADPEFNTLTALQHPFIDEGLWGFEIADADGYVLAFCQARNT